MAKFSKAPSFKSQSPFSPIECVCARIVAFGKHDEIFVQGSCVRIAKNLYLTARHVMTDFIQRFGHDGDSATFGAWVVHISPGPEYSIWEMEELWFSALSDLAVFHTKPCNDIAASESVAAVRLDLRPPAVGSRVVGFGYHTPTGRITFNEDGIRHIEINTVGAATVGEVREIHRRQRDAVRLPFPCFRVNARFDGGMSGGPVFTDAGHVCGVICSSFPASTEEEEHSSYVTTLWPLMGMGINCDLAPLSIPRRPYPFIELVRHGIIHVDDLSQVVVRPCAAPYLYDVTFVEKLDA